MESCSSSPTDSDGMEPQVEHVLRARKPRRKSTCRPRKVCRWMVLQLAIMCLYLAAFFIINSDTSLQGMEGRSVGALDVEPPTLKPAGMAVPIAQQPGGGQIPAQAGQPAPAPQEQVAVGRAPAALPEGNQQPAARQAAEKAAYPGPAADPDDRILEAIQVPGKPPENHNAVMPNNPVVEKAIKKEKDAAADKVANKPMLFKMKGNKLVLPPELAAKEPAKDVYKVLLFTYMRGGSSFLGQMFDKNPDAMYLFEPLDGAYSSMYGVPLLVPSLDLTHFANGTKRSYSKDERTFIAQTVNNILSCNHWKLPTEILIHPFVYRKVKSKSFGFFGDCISQFNVESYRWKCVPFKPTCDKQKPGAKGLRCDLIGKDLVRLTKRRPKQEYWDCLKKLRNAAMYCVSLMEAECRRTSLRALKSVRLTAEIIKEILAKYRDIKIIYYLRDPRGIVPSRVKEQLLSTNSHKDQIREIKMLGEDMAADIPAMVQLQRMYPLRVKIEFYEHFAKDPAQVAKDAYSFIGAPMPPVVAKHLYNITHAAGSEKQAAFETARTNATATAFAWRTTLSKETIQQMNSVLSGYFHSAKLVSSDYRP